jgi:hypothetical protein
MYYRTIPTNLAVAAIASLIADEEAGGSKFVENKVTVLKTSNKPGTPKNMATFVEVDDHIPAEPVLALQGDAPPAGKTLQWNGVMLVGGTMSVVELYR